MICCGFQKTLPMTCRWESESSEVTVFFLHVLLFPGDLLWVPKDPAHNLSVESETSEVIIFHLPVLLRST